MWPIKVAEIAFTRGRLSDQHASGRGPFEIPQAKRNLPMGLPARIELSRCDGEESAALRETRIHITVLAVIRYLGCRDVIQCIVNIEEIITSPLLQKPVMYSLMRSADAVEVHHTRGPVRERAKANRVDASLQLMTSATDRLPDYRAAATGPDDYMIEFAENRQPVAKIVHVVNPEFVKPAHSGPAAILPAVDRVDIPNVGPPGAHLQKQIVVPSQLHPLQAWIECSHASGRIMVRERFHPARFDVVGGCGL